VSRSKDHWTGQVVADEIDLDGDTLKLQIVVDHDPQRPMTVELSRHEYQKLQSAVPEAWDDA